MTETSCYYVYQSYDPNCSFVGVEGKFQDLLCNQRWDNQSCRLCMMFLVPLKSPIPLTIALVFFSFLFLNFTWYFMFLQFFEMSKLDAIKALSIYKRAGQQVDKFICFCIFYFLQIWYKISKFLI